MSITEVVLFTVRCDECGINAFEGSDYVAYTDAESAREVFIDSCDDWSSFPQGRASTKDRCPEHNRFCEECGEDAGELCGERDFLCSACFHSLEKETK